jgi:signal transduction histidine kinase
MKGKKFSYPTREAVMPIDTQELPVKPTQTEKLTPHFLQQLERQKYYAVACVFLLIVLSVIWLFWQFGNAPGQDGPALFSNSMYTLTSLIGATWIFIIVYRARHGPVVLERRLILAWLLIGLGLVANGLGNIYYGFYQYTLKIEPPIPTYADIGYTLFYIFVLTGLFILPTRINDNRLRIRIAIDSLIMAFCLFGVGWYFFIGPIILPNSMWENFTIITESSWDILLILAIVLFLRGRVAPEQRFSLLICSLGVLSIFWADLSFSYLADAGKYNSGTLSIDPFWFLGYLLLGLSAIYQYHAIARRAYSMQVTTAHIPLPAVEDQHEFSRRFLLLQSLLLYLPFIVLLIVTLYGSLTSDGVQVHFLEILSALVTLLIITHYILITYENERLIREKERDSRVAELLRKSTASLSSVLEMDLLLNHIVTIAAAELGFAATALVLIAEYERPLDEQTSLLARAITSDATQVAAWRVTGKKIPYCLALMGNELEILWAHAPQHTATDVHQWHQDQQIQTSFFVPLVYQGKIQGSITFSLRAARSLTAQERYLARAFAEEAANAIEHAHLYERARENELFAQAMSTIAGRLNSLVATGMGMGNEIHQLICTEGARALGADLALLYVNNQSQFIPLAGVVTEAETPIDFGEWPTLRNNEYEILLSRTHQPSLMQITQPLFTETFSGLYPNASTAWIVSSEQEKQNSDIFANLFIAQIKTAPLSSLLSPARPVSTPLVPSTQSIFALQTSLRHRYVHTAILAPLLVQQKSIGLLILARTHHPGASHKRSFAAQDLAHAQDFAGQASIAFTNARLYQQLRNAHRRMQELDQLKDQFMITASHELRTPLTAVQGYLELLEQYHAMLPSEQQQEFVQKASRGCEELVLLLNNVTDASFLETEAGIQPEQFQRVPVREVVESVIGLMGPQITQENRHLQIHIASQLMVKADPTRLRQIIRNLSVNALKYSPPNTPLFFSAHPSPGKNPSVIISVADRGKGIKLADQAKLFHRFVRLESDLNSTVRGSGLGLYISRRLVEAMNGRIWVESAGVPGMGTTFHVQLPIAW